jgi:hypothetical protein
MLVSPFIRTILAGNSQMQRRPVTRAAHCITGAAHCIFGGANGSNAIERRRSFDFLSLIWSLNLRHVR